ncbi:MAG: YqgE/AlgH family protein [Betaproteobacteria bacterium]|nr:YqgE/AlgH family protein [Betaproteobacteria bacterium]
MKTADTPINLTNHFLIAMPGMADPHFSKSLTLVCEHTDKGAIGIIINKPTDLLYKEIFRQVGLHLADPILSESQTYFGGPVLPDRGFVLHQPLGEWNSTLRVSDVNVDDEDSLGLTTSKDILEAMTRGQGPRKVLLTLGYAGWGPGQLEDEIARNGWLTTPASPHIIFDLAHSMRLNAAIATLGFSVANLSEVAGHA